MICLPLFAHLASQLNSLRPEVDLMGTDMANIRSGVTRLTKAVNTGGTLKRRHTVLFLFKEGVH